MRDDMRDDHRAPNGRRGSAPNGVRGPGGPFTRALPAGDEKDAPIDLVAVQADDELVGAIGSRSGAPLGGPPAGGTDDRLVAMLAAWRAEIDAEPIPELVDLDAAVAAVLSGVETQNLASQSLAARRRRAGRLRHLAPLAAAAAIIVATVGGVGLGSQNAVPGDTLWPIQKVVNPERAESVEAKIAVEGHLQKVRAALEKGDTVTAAQELEAIRTQIPVVRGEEGQPGLLQEQEFLAAKLADTPPGTPANLSTPAKSNPAARSTGDPVPPVPDVPPAGPAATQSSGPPETGPEPTDPGGPDRPDPALAPDPSAPLGGGDPAGPDPDVPEPQVTSEPDVDQQPPGPGPGNGEGGPDDSTAPAPDPDQPAPDGDGGAAPGDGDATPSSDTATASGSAGAAVEATATGTTS